jgi:predicted peptidase
MAADAAKILDVTAITDTKEDGEKFVAVAVHYDQAIAAGTAKLQDFTVRGRDINRLYVNDSGAVGDARDKGNYVVFELATSDVPGNTLGATTYYGFVDGSTQPKLTNRLPVQADIMQNADLKTTTGATARGGLLEVTKQTNPLVDAFQDLSFKDPASGITVKYRLFIPRGYEVKNSAESLPLVVFLHGSGERGDNNVSQMVGNASAIEFVRREAQSKHPAFVLAPQNPDVTTAWAKNAGTPEQANWVSTSQLDAVKKIIDATLEHYNIDGSRIYGVGLSQGSKGTMRLSMDHPGMFAAQINSSGVDNRYSDEDAAKLVKSKNPIWALSAVDDPTNPSADVRKLMDQFQHAGATVTRQTGDKAWNGFARGTEANNAAHAQWDAAKTSGSEILYTEYVAGTVLPNPHASWMPNFSNEVVRDWLFSHVNSKPYRLN